MEYQTEGGEALETHYVLGKTVMGMFSDFMDFRFNGIYAVVADFMSLRWKARKRRTQVRPCSASVCTLTLPLQDGRSIVAVIQAGRNT